VDWGVSKFAQLRNDFPGLWIIAVAFDTSHDLGAFAAAGVNVMAVSVNALTSEYVQQAHALGMRVAAWTVDARADRDRAIGYGGDEIYTDNYPWVAGLMEPAPLPFSDTFERSVVGTAWTTRQDQAQWKALPTGAVSRPGASGVNHLVCVGAKIQDNPRHTRIKVTYTPRQLNADNTRW